MVRYKVGDHVEYYKQEGSDFITRGRILDIFAGTKSVVNESQLSGAEGEVHFLIQDDETGEQTAHHKDCIKQRVPYVEEITDDSWKPRKLVL